MLLEVETKIKIDKVNSLRKKIKKISKFEKTESGGDDYFALKPRGYPEKAFRIRYDGGKFVVNFKKHLKKLYGEGIVVKEEYEFQLKDLSQIKNFLALIGDLGFQPWVKKENELNRIYIKNIKKL